MPIFYTDNPVNVSGSVQTAQSSVVTASVPGPVNVTSSVASPVWITGTIQSVATQATAFTTGVLYPSSGNLNLYVSGAANATVFGRVGTGTMGQAALVTLASDQPTISVSQSNIPAGTVTMTGTVGVWNAITGTVGVWNIIQVSQSNVPAGTMTTSQSNMPAGTQPVSIAATVTTSQSNIPAGPFQVASGLGAIGVSGTFWQTTQPISVAATLATSQSNIPAGTQTVSGNFNVGINGTVTVSGNYNVGINGTVTTSQSNVPAGTLYVNSTATLTTTGTVGVWNTVVVSQSNVPAGTVAMSQTNLLFAITASQDKAGTTTLTQRDVGTANTVLLVANAARKGATIFNTQQVVFIGLGQTPSVTLYHAKVPSSSYYEIPYNFTGQVNAIAYVSGQLINLSEFT